MEAIIEQIKERKKEKGQIIVEKKDKEEEIVPGNIYIESQTGTGKTIALFCSILTAVQKKVIYTSRTHY